MKSIFIFCFTLVTFQLLAQMPPEGAKGYVNQITANDLKEKLTTIASDEFQGRETGTEGQLKAAKYITSYFDKWGLPTVGDDNTHYQNIPFWKDEWVSVEMNINGTSYKNMKDFYAFPAENTTSNFVVDKVYFLGYGIDDKNYSDYKKRNLKGKCILIYKGEPKLADGTYPVTGTTSSSEWSRNYTKKLEAAKKNGVKHIFIVDDQISKNIDRYRRFLLGGRLKVEENKNLEKFANTTYISRDMAKAMMGKRLKKVVKARDYCINTKGKAKKVTLKTEVSLSQQKKPGAILSPNLLAYVEGTDDKLKEELVVVSAHYDHLGTRGNLIFNGADDNGSGTSAILEIAETFVAAKNGGDGPRRSILFLFMTGEEKGLLGSDYYTKNPVFPLENTIVDVNVDMVGRVDTFYTDNPNYIYVIGADRLSSELHEINEAMNKEHTQLTLDYKYNDENDPNRYYFRSDHYNFAKNGIPAIFYFNGVHADYHRASDTVEKIHFEKMTNITKLVFHTVWELANRDQRIVVDKK